MRLPLAKVAMDQLNFIRIYGDTAYGAGFGAGPAEAAFIPVEDKVTLVVVPGKGLCGAGFEAGRGIALLADHGKRENQSSLFPTDNLNGRLGRGA